MLKYFFSIWVIIMHYKIMKKIVVFIQIFVMEIYVDYNLY